MLPNTDKVPSLLLEAPMEDFGEDESLWAGSREVQEGRRRDREMHKKLYRSMEWRDEINHRRERERERETRNDQAKYTKRE